MRTVVILSVLCVSLAGQVVPEDDGPFGAGWLDTSVAGIPGGNGTVGLRVVYPAIGSGQGAAFDPAAGSCPVVVFGHGFSLPATLYQSLFRHLATHGYVSALVRTEEGLFTGNLPRFVEDFRATVMGLRALGQSSGPLAGAVAVDARAAAVGHSFGGAAALVAASGRSDLFATVVTMAATSTSPQGVNILAATAGLVDQPCLHLGASQDGIVPVWANLDPLYAATPTSRRKVVIGGGTHSYFHEQWWIDRLAEPPGLISVAEQQRLTRRYMHAFLASFLERDPALLDALLGPSAVQDPGLWSQATDLEEPLLFTSGPVALGNVLELHPAWKPGDMAWIGLSLATTSISTMYGEMLIDPGASLTFNPVVVGPEGFAQLSYLTPSMPSLSGQVAYGQAFVLNPAAGLALTNLLVIPIP